MNENEKWSFHVEYLKLAIALATAVIAAAAAIYVDSSKIPMDSTRYFLLYGIGAFFAMLITSVWSLALLGSHLVDAGRLALVTGTLAIQTARNDEVAGLSQNVPSETPPQTRLAGTPNTSDGGAAQSDRTPRVEKLQPPTKPSGGQETRNRTSADSAVDLANCSFVFLVLGAGLLGAFFVSRTLTVDGPSFERALATANAANRTLIDVSKNESTNLKAIELQADWYELEFQISPGGGRTAVVTDSSGAILRSAKRE
jgi:hypothetical protein